MKKGIDISAYQPNIDWDQVKDAGIEFILIQLTQGLHYINPLEVDQSDKAKLEGLDFGFYHFGHPECNSATDEANFFIAQIRRNDIPTATLIPALDVEQVYQKNQLVNLPSGTLEKWVKEFAAVMAANGFPKIMIYSNAYYLDSNLPASHSLGGFPLWLSAYTVEEPVPAKGWSEITIWQDSGKALIPGIPEPVDTNECADLTLVML